MMSDGLAFKPLMKLSEEQSYPVIEELTPKSTAFLSTPASSPSSTTWHPLPSQNEETLLDCTHFMDFLSFQQGALTPKPPPLSRWVWCYHFPGHSIFGFRPRRCAKQRLLHPQWPKVSLKKNLRKKKTLKYSWQRLRLRSALQWEAMEMRKAAFI